MARPTKNAHERRTAHIPPVRMTVAEIVHVEDLASDTGLTVSEYVRQRLLDGKVTPRRSDTTAGLLAELNRIGNNVNQIARQINRGRDHDPHHLNHVMGELVSTLHKVGGR